MKVFIQPGTSPPRVIAVYSDDSDVKADAHAGAQMITVAPDALLRPAGEGGVPGNTTLATDWQERTDRAKIFSASDRVNTTYELLRLVMKNGHDVNTWPSADRDREIAIQRRWNLS